MPVQAQPYGVSRFRQRFFMCWAGTVANDALNCNALVAAVAQSAGLKVPSGPGSTRPWKFIEALKKLN